MEAPDTFEKRLTLLMEENLGNESFGASELAEQMNLSRSQLHRKIHQVLDKSTTQYMREFRLERAKDLLTHSDLTVAEISYRCGFNSATYFSSVFTHHFNRTPVQFRTTSQMQADPGSKREKKPVLMLTKAVIILVIVAMSTWFIQNLGVNGSQSTPNLETKALVIQPLHNLNLTDDEKYICEGIRGAIRSQLSTIRDLRIIHASAGEFYENQTIGQIRDQTTASHILTGQLQRYRDTLRVEVNLIDLNTGDQIWGDTYDRPFEDLLSLQSEIAEKISLALRIKLKLGKEMQMITLGQE